MMRTLKDHFQSEIEAISQMIDQAPFEDASFYHSWMSQQYWLVQNSTRYVALAASLVDLEDSAAFRDWAHHLSEELDHDKTLLADIRSLGTSDVESIYPETRALIGAQYYDLQKNGPNALLGYALLLEGLSCARCAKVAERVEKSHGKKSSYLLLHAKVDQEHFPEGLEKVSDLDAQQSQIISSNLEMSSALYQVILQKLMVTRFEQKMAS